ncbi:MAG: hypothetical protein AABZ85_06230, partial [Thermodesulfobacteriota bacterium]
MTPKISAARVIFTDITQCLEDQPFSHFYGANLEGRGNGSKKIAKKYPSRTPANANALLIVRIT